MKIESPSYGVENLEQFLDEMTVHDLGLTRARLKAGLERLEVLAARIREEAASEDTWNAKEILAHIAVMSRAYGYLSSQVAKGALDELPFVPFINQRDHAGEAMAQRSVAEIMEECRTQITRTLEFMDRVSPRDLRRTVTTEARVITAEALLRLPLVSHLEMHLLQLEESLTRSAGT